MIRVAPAIVKYREAAQGRGRTMDERLVERLQAIAPTKRGEPLSRHTTFGIGGPADIFVTVRNARELMQAVVAARHAGAPFFVLGAGSNILVGDGGVRGVVIDNQATAVDGPHEREGGLIVTAESGTPFATLARSMAKQGYGGIEWAAGIPGTLGGAVVYNAGAYDGCLADVLRAVAIIDVDDRERRLPAAELELTYRNSVFTRGAFAGRVLLTVELALERGDARALAGRIAEFDRQRLEAQPRGRNSGSTFKNPAERQAWELIDAVGLRGERRGDAQFSEKHCNFIANLGKARAADVAALMREAQRRVRERFGIELENEVALVGEGF
ncbi:MAG: UDP-N-acetylmuramate dehydrogenase [Dehalococcoidia bacterium]